jgi:methanogenic corrinoid protein MtbC1
MGRKEEIKQGLYNNTLTGRAKEVVALTEEGMALGLEPLEILFGSLIPALQEVGRRFETGEFFVPEMLVSAKAMQGALTLLRPVLAQTGLKPIGKVLMLTVKGDLHDIGKNLCNIMLEGAGFAVTDLGTNVSVDKLMAAVKEHQPPLIGFSAFLTTTMPMFKIYMDVLAKEGLRSQSKIMVGGAPVTKEYADRAGADGYAPDASSAVRLAKSLMADLGYDVSGGAEASKQTAAAVDAITEVFDKIGKVEAAQSAERQKIPDSK